MQRTPPFLNFAREHEALNTTVKGLEAAMALAAEANPDLINSTVSALSRKWRKGIDIDPSFFRLALPRLAAGMSIVHAAGILEEYIKSFEGTRGSRGYKSRKIDPNEKIEAKVEALFLRTGWAWPAKTDCLLRVHQFYRLARNCAAHRGGIASSDYAEACLDDELESAWEELSVYAKGGLPTIPKCKADEAIPLSGIHVIMFSAVNLWLAEVVEECFANECAASVPAPTSTSSPPWSVSRWAEVMALEAAGQPPPGARLIRDDVSIDD